MNRHRKEGMPLVGVPQTHSNVKRIVAIDCGENMEAKWNKYGVEPMMNSDD
jgi:hypothetical protein